MVRLQDDIFDTKIPLTTTIDQYFQGKILMSLEDIDRLKIQNGISHLVTRAKVVNNFIDNDMDKNKMNECQYKEELAILSLVRRL